ncbi:Por secretion system C-terminal sorting domain-containing protein [Neolewinella agarilytica]|uniref:Por secretion system C-terminal sorting domain-containing protein n=2 Tax=Neolewinella agarilytica TaxID=478744 RepID=A0A1H9M0F4_9BACT|nr:Por secretion system C-terminal sorting domain-containing protein [Neolewinella agarilytica]
MHGLRIIFCLLLTYHLNAQNHTPVFPELTGEELMQQVVASYKTTSVLDYGTARDILYGTIDIKNDSVSGIYTGHKLYLPPGVDPSIHLFMDGASDGINAEHTYPRSKGARNGNGFSDMHHLFPSRTAVNASRNNFPFEDINDQETTSWFYLNESQSSPPNVDVDLYSERINGAFEPRESKKGDIARAMIYFYTMYKEEALAADPDFFEEQRETLCRWHQEDPVDEAEWERTFMIAKYQDDLPNPFILDSTLVERTYCEGVTGVEYQSAIEVKLFPNPVIDVLFLRTEEIVNVIVINHYGKIVYEKKTIKSVDIDFSRLESGFYILMVNGLGQKVLKL